MTSLYVLFGAVLVMLAGLAGLLLWHKYVRPILDDRADGRDVIDHRTEDERDPAAWLDQLADGEQRRRGDDR
ncbi:hypothetical protein H0B56_12255 [Haloechinothrix sp. YIM 98757]|uniref:Uncharacterized protein n=1 Tax=Haloechinothrix aidingensis TaxID=2752311 RepID=A0A838AAR7_9PSEU|nr:hypothetical protein [Haloechinothrix aidingensis]MBA0126315.1 hypothetical protein [Haloechinothrix aidingensis]